MAAEDATSAYTARNGFLLSIIFREANDIKLSALACVRTVRVPGTSDAVVNFSLR